MQNFRILFVRTSFSLCFHICLRHVSTTWYHHQVYVTIRINCYIVFTISYETKNIQKRYTSLPQQQNRTQKKEYRRTQHIFLKLFQQESNLVLFKLIFRLTHLACHDILNTA
jgi:hypothetical protein